MWKVFSKCSNCKNFCFGIHIRYVFSIDRMWKINEDRSYWYILASVLDRFFQQFQAPERRRWNDEIYYDFHHLSPDSHLRSLDSSIKLCHHNSVNLTDSSLIILYLWNLVCIFYSFNKLRERGRELVVSLLDLNSLSLSFLQNTQIFFSIMSKIFYYFLFTRFFINFIYKISQINSAFASDRLLDSIKFVDIFLLHKIPNFSMFLMSAITSSIKSDQSAENYISEHSIYFQLYLIPKCNRSNGILHENPDNNRNIHRM